MLKKPFIERLKELQDPKNDPEIAHPKADEILCELLIGLGFEEVVNEFKKVEKWYS